MHFGGLLHCLQGAQRRTGLALHSPQRIGRIPGSGHAAWLTATGSAPSMQAQVAVVALLSNACDNQTATNMAVQALSRSEEMNDPSAVLG